ncbi:hypothetical protein [Streptomyces sp. WMMC940]|uniref:hypothetical protein n=1 Tax=Streptomyces sp. WMMC940 TaxID=3015153 RepID=UPI0022B603E3|nr:hypothetical protein [Streptomyces sp. WMMC940]MCZ7459713.1 hypothetical protein [Streptomyces sp. WMMC940]
MTVLMSARRPVRVRHKGLVLALALVAMAAVGAVPSESVRSAGPAADADAAVTVPEAVPAPATSNGSTTGSPPEHQELSSRVEVKAKAEVLPLRMITDVLTTDATVPDVKATRPVQQNLADCGLTPGEHYLDAGYPSADLIHDATHRRTCTL